MNTILAVFIGGGFGSLCRFMVGKFTARYFTGDFPLATLISNVVSSLILALFIAFYGHKLAGDSSLKMLIVVGFCGGFSTFSTFGYETFLLLKTANYWFAVLNILISILAAIFIMYLIIKNI